MSRSHKTLRRLVAARDGLRCHWCRRVLKEPPCSDDERATLEHLVSQDAGGGNDLSNLVLACRPCNLTRQNAPTADTAAPLPVLRSTPPPNMRRR
jgi:5-methylcytosine-specific restriction endonuclease McrA